MNNIIRFILSFLFLPILLMVEVFKSTHNVGKKILYSFAVLLFFSFTWLSGWHNIVSASTFALYELGISDRLKNVPIRGTSMMPGIIDGSTVTLKSPKKYGIERGDIVTFNNIETGNLSYIKRVIGLPGETISIVNGVVLINNQALNEPYVYQNNPTYGNTFLSDCDSYTIPKGKVAVMGDNRIVSMDSRIIGFIDKNDIDGVLKTVEKPTFTAITNHPKLQTTTTLDPQTILLKLNALRRDRKVDNLMINPTLSSIATQRATMAAADINKWKKNQLDLTKQLDSQGYSYLIVQDMMTFGYLTEEQLVDQITQSPIYGDEFLSGKYFELGIGSVRANKNQCSFPVISLIVSMPTNPTYSEDTLNSWTYEIEYLTRTVTALQSLKFDSRVNNSQTQQLVDETSSLLSQAADIESHIKNNEWILKTESDSFDSYIKKADENKAKLQSYYEQYHSLLTDARSSKLLLALVPGQTEFNTKLEEARLYFAQGKFAQQLKASEELLTLSEIPNEQATAYYWIGLAEYKLHSIEKAKEHLLHAAELNIQYSGPYVTLAAIAYDEGRYQDGLQLAKKCAELDPTYAWCHNNIGLGYLYLNQKQKGIEELQKAVSLDPTNYTFSDNLKRAKEQ